MFALARRGGLVRVLAVEIEFELDVWTAWFGIESSLVQYVRDTERTLHAHVGSDAALL